MAQFDVFRPRDGEELLLDCQSNFLDRLETRFVVPLLSPDDMPKRIAKLNPRFEIDGREFFMATQGAATIPARMIGARHGPARPRSGTTTTGNSRPLALWIVIRRTASSASTADSSSS